MPAVYSRVTVIGRYRQVDAVLPADEPFGRLLPDLLQMLGEPLEPTPRRRYLTTATGAMVSPELSLAGAAIVDGAVLRLAAEGELPPPPTVYDITEEAVEDLERRTSVFGRRERIALSGAGLVFAILAGAVALALSAPTAVASFILLLVGVVTVAAGIGVGIGGKKPLAVAMLTTGLSMFVVLALTFGIGEDMSGPMVAGLVAVALALGPMMFAAAKLAGGGLVGTGTGLFFAVLWIIGIQLGGATERIGAVVAVVVVLLLGLLPRLALSMSGLTSLDDRRAQGQEIQRISVAAALNAAHVGLALSVAWIAASAAAAGLLLATHRSGWTIAIAILLAFLLCSRSRLYPLTVEVALLWGAAAVVIGGVTYELAVTATGGSLIAVGLLVVVGMVSLMGLVFTPQDHVQARLTQALDVVQVAAVVALIPLALGAFGVYGDLLNAL